jgi:hypothetical protein
VPFGIEPLRVALLAGIAAEQCLPIAPAAAADDSPVALDDEIRTIANQLCIDAERTTQRRFDLCRCVIGSAQRADGAGHQLLEHEDFFEMRKSDVECHTDI